MNARSPAAQGLLRTLAFFQTMRYAPTHPEWCASFDTGTDPSVSAEELSAAAKALVDDGLVMSARGRVTLPDAVGDVALHEEREHFFPRKLRRARAVAQYLSRLSGVRFVALCNTTALAHAGDVSDLDFFVVTRRGTVWQTRFFAALPFKVLHLRPDADAPIRDAVCLSFFVDDAALDLSSLALPQDDPYLRHWFLSLFPLYDDGVGAQLWDANAALRERHPFATKWQTQEGVAVNRSRLRWPAIRTFEPFTRQIQTKAFPPAVKERINQGTDVVVNDHVLKFHVEDARAAFRSRYVERCQALGLEP